MKRCRTVKGLIRAIKKGEKANLRVWGIMRNDFDPHGAYLNLGEGRYAQVGEDSWKLICNHLVSEDGEYCKYVSKYRYYYRHVNAA